MTEATKQKILNYLKDNDDAFGMQYYDKNKKEVVTLYTISALTEALDRVIEADRKAVGPNYEGMYKQSMVSLKEAQDRINYLEDLNRNYALERAHYVGAVQAFELIFGRKLAFHECGDAN